MGEKYTCRWAFLGLSAIAETFIADLLLPREDSDLISHQLVTVSTTGSQDRARSWLKDHQVPNPEKIHIFSSFEEMLAKGTFDVVYVSTPHSLHYLHVRTALNNKRNVLLEKPATMNREQYQKLVTLAEKQNVVLMEAMWTRYLPATKYLQDTLLPKIGHVRRVFSDFSFPIVSPELPPSSRWLDKKAGAGAILDMGVYALTWVDLAFSASSTTRVVHADSIAYDTGTDHIDDINTVVLSRPKSAANPISATAIATTSLSGPGSSKPSFGDRLNAKKMGPSVIIEGTEAQVAIPFLPPRPQQLSVQWYGREHVDEKGLEVEEIIEKPVERGWGLWYQADVIAKTVHEREGAGQHGKGVVIGGDESLRVLGWLDDVRKLAGITYDPELEAV